MLQIANFEKYEGENLHLPESFKFKQKWTKYMKKWRFPNQMKIRSAFRLISNINLREKQQKLLESLFSDQNSAACVLLFGITQSYL